MESRRNALVLSAGWWLLRRKLKKRANVAVTGLMAGEGLAALSGRKQRSKGPRRLLTTAALAGGAWLAWKRLRGGRGDDGGGGGWERPEPQSPAPTPPAVPEPAPDPDRVPVPA